MERVFQDDNGHVVCLGGLSFSCVKAIEEVSSGDVLLLWLQDAETHMWYRAFIDGLYCGIDCFDQNCSDEDLNEGDVVSDYSAWFQGKTVASASVEFIGKADLRMELVLDFNDSQCRLVCLSEDGECQVSFSE